MIERNSQSRNSGAGLPRWLLTAGSITAILALFLVFFLTSEPLPADTFQPARLIGKPLRLATTSGERLFLLSEQYGTHWFWGHGTGGRRWSSPASEQVLNYDLWAFEPGNAVPVWRRRYRNNPPDPMTDVGDLLVAQADVLRLKLHEPVHVSVVDGQAVTTAVATDGPQQRGDEVYDLRDVLARGLRIGDRWIGVLTAAEHAKLTATGAGDWRPDALGPVGESLEYQLWTARVRDRREAWGKVGQYSDFRRLDAAPPFQQAGLLKSGQDLEAIILAEPDSVLVLHREPAASGGRLQLSRVDLGDGRVIWNSVLPLVTLEHLLPGQPDLALLGASAVATTGVQPPQWLSFIDLRDGTHRDFDLGKASLGPAPAP